MPWSTSAASSIPISIIISSPCSWCCYRWRRGKDDAPRAALWPWRLLLVQLSLVYAWAAIAKLDGAWLDGTVLAAQLGEGFAREQIARIGFAWVARFIVAIELALAVLLQLRRAWLVALLLGVGFHLGVELSGFRIGLFSYFMLALYLLLVPESWIAAMARLGSTARARMAMLVARPVRRSTGLVLVILASVLVLLVPLAQAPLIAVLVAALGAPRRHDEPAPRHDFGARSGECAAGGARALHQLRPRLLPATGAAARGRLDQRDDIGRAYRGLLAVDPGYGPAYFHLGNEALRDHRHEEALALFHQAQLFTPSDVRAFVGEATVHHQRGDGAAAHAAARRALAVDPQNRRALELERRYRP